MDAPAHALELLLAQAVAVACRRARVIGHAVAFDAEQIRLRPARIAHREIDAVARAANLGVEGQPLGRQRGVDGLLERRLDIAQRAVRKRLLRLLARQRRRTVLGIV